MVLTQPRLVSYAGLLYALLFAERLCPHITMPSDLFQVCLRLCFIQHTIEARGVGRRHIHLCSVSKHVRSPGLCVYSVTGACMCVDECECIVQTLIQDIISEGQDTARRMRHQGMAVPNPCLMYKWHGKAYLGAAHGVVGVLHVRAAHC